MGAGIGFKSRKARELSGGDAATTIAEAKSFGARTQHSATRGGLIRGLGTGTSDSIPKDVRPGSYIMPADSTDQIGPLTLATMGVRGFNPKADRSPVAVRLSNGEYELPPEQVHAVGVQALEQLKHATHTPVAEQQSDGEGPAFYFADGGIVEAARGFRPQLPSATRKPEPGSAFHSPATGYADGGLIDDTTKPTTSPTQVQGGMDASPGAVTRTGNSYSGGNVSGSISVNGRAPGGTMSIGDAYKPPPAPPPTATTTPPTTPPGGVNGGVSALSGLLASLQKPAAPTPAPTFGQFGGSAPAAAPAPGGWDANQLGSALQKLMTPAPPPPPVETDRNAAFFREAQARNEMSRQPYGIVGRRLGFADGGAVTGHGFDPQAFRESATKTRASGLDSRRQERGYANGGVVDAEEVRGRSSFFTPPPVLPTMSGEPPKGAPGIAYERGVAPFARTVQPAPAAAPASMNSAGAVSAANDAALKFGGFPLDDSQKMLVAEDFDQRKRDYAAGAAAGFAPAYGISAPRAAAPALAAPSTMPTQAQVRAIDNADPVPSPKPDVYAAITDRRPAPQEVDVTPNGSPATAPAVGFRLGAAPAADAVMAASQPLNQGAGIIGPADYANRNAGFNNEAALRTAAARGSWSPRRGFQADQGAIDAAALPIKVDAQRADTERRAQSAETISVQNNAGDIARTTARETGENARANVRASSDAGRTAVDAGRLELDRTTQGFQTSAARRLQDLQERYLASKDPKEQAALAKQIREFQGKDAPARFKVASGGQTTDANGVPIKTPDRVFNEQTGEFVDAPAAANNPSTRPVGTKSTVNGKTAVWDGRQWIPQSGNG